LGIFDKLRKKKITKTIEKEEISREKMKINEREKRKIEHNKEKADISAELVTSKVKQVEITIEPRDKPEKPKKKKKSKKEKPLTEEKWFKDYSKEREIAEKSELERIRNEAIKKKQKSESKRIKKKKSKSKPKKKRGS